VEDLLTIECLEATCTIWHETLTLSGTNLGAQISSITVAEDAIPLLALGCVAWHNKVADFVICHTFTNTLNDCCGFVAQNHRKETFGVTTSQRVDISVAESVRDDFYSDFAFAWGFDLDVDNLDGLIGRKSDGCFTND
jgi:hypothetical protein